MTKDKLKLKYKGKDIDKRLPELLGNLKEYEMLEFVMDDRKYHVRLVNDLSTTHPSTIQH